MGNENSQKIKKPATMVSIPFAHTCVTVHATLPVRYNFDVIIRHVV